MKNSFPTLDQIREIIHDEGKTIIAAFDKDLKSLDGKINSLDNKLDDFRIEVNKRFDANDDAHQDLIGITDEIADRKISKHCQKYHGVTA